MAISTLHPSTPTLGKTVSMNHSTSFMSTSQPQLHHALKEKCSMGEMVDDSDIIYNIESSFVKVCTYENVLNGPIEFVNKVLLNFIKNTIKMYQNITDCPRI